MILKIDGDFLIAKIDIDPIGTDFFCIKFKVKFPIAEIRKLLNGEISELDQTSTDEQDASLFIESEYYREELE